MIMKIPRLGRLTLFLGLGLLAATQTYAGGGAGGGGGRGGGGGGFGGGGGGGGGGFGGGGAAGGSTQRTYPNATSPGPVSVSIDPETHSLVVLTDDRTITHLQDLVDKLDQPKPQVLIKVVFLQVSRDDALDIGVEGSYNPSSGMNTITSNIVAGFGGVLTTNLINSTTSGNIQNNYLLGAQGTQPSLIGPNTMPAGAGIYSVMGADYAATVRAISSANKVEVLARPSIMVRNNQPATIQIGQQVPIVTSVTYANNTGTPIAATTPTSVGIILQVTPFITADGLVEMIVSPQISDLSSQTVQLAAGVNQPIIDITQASTVVVAPDGQTVVIGGLIQNQKTGIDTKIPILGDIPVLGLLFKRTQRDHFKKELVIFVTPHVVAMPSMMADASNEAVQSDLAKRAFTQKEWNEYFENMNLKKSDLGGISTNTIR